MIQGGARTCPGPALDAVLHTRRRDPPLRGAARLVATARHRHLGSTRHRPWTGVTWRPLPVGLRRGRLLAGLRSGLLPGGPGGKRRRVVLRRHGTTLHACAAPRDRDRPGAQCLCHSGGGPGKLTRVAEGCNMRWADRRPGMIRTGRRAGREVVGGYGDHDERRFCGGGAGDGPGGGPAGGPVAPSGAGGAAGRGAYPRVPRAEIDASWDRAVRCGVDPDQSPESELLEADEIEHRRHSTALGELMPLLRAGLASIADAARQIMVVTDAEGRVLWRQGNAGVLRRAHDICLEEGRPGARRRPGRTPSGRRWSTGPRSRSTRRSTSSGRCTSGPAPRPRYGTRATDGCSGSSTSAGRPPRSIRRHWRWSTRWPGWRRASCAPVIWRRSSGCGRWPRRSCAGSAGGRWRWTCTGGWRR